MLRVFRLKIKQGVMNILPNQDGFAETDG